MFGTSPFAKQMSRKIKHLAGKDVLLVGEPGTGKQYLALQIHNARSKDGSYVLLDGQSVSHPEIQAVLFGRNRDLVRSMTGHDPAKLSKNATLCIANVDELGPHEQIVIATFVQKHRKEYPGMCVILTASDIKNVSLDASSFETVEVPALRDRPEDIPDLVKSLLKSMDKDSLHVADNLFRVLGKSNWPGNVRELSKVIGKGVLISEGDELRLPLEYLDEHQHVQNAIESIGVMKSFDLDKSLWLIEKLLIERLLNVTKDNQSKAAAGVGLSEANFRYRLKKFGIKSVREKK